MIYNITMIKKDKIKTKRKYHTQRQQYKSNEKTQKEVLLGLSKC